MVSHETGTLGPHGHPGSIPGVGAYIHKMEKTAEELREFGIITRIISQFCESAKLGNFQDSIKFSTENSKDMLINIDSFAGFLPRENLSEDKFITYGHICATSTISDIVVSGGKPLYFGTGIIIPKDMKEPELANFFKGVKRVLDEYNMQNIGGDTNISDVKRLDGITIALGKLEEGSTKINRNTAKPGEIIFLTARSGVGWSNLVMLKKVKKNIQDPTYVEFWKKHKKELESVEIKPILPVKAFLECSKKRLLTSATDITDGIGEIFANDYQPNNIGMQLNFKKEFLANCAQEIIEKESVHPINAFVNHGMDMPVQALITCSREDKEEVIKIFQENNITLYEIGIVIDKPSFKCYYENNELEIEKPILHEGGVVDPFWYSK